MNWAEKWLSELSQATGASVESSDVARLLEYDAAIKAGTATQGQLDEHMAGLRAQYIRRGAGTSHRAQDSQSGLYQDIGGDPQAEPGFTETRDTSLFNIALAPPRPRPAPVASVITTGGATSGALASPTVGPVGLAYPDDPVNYATGEQSADFGYPGGLTSGIYPSGGGLAAAGTPGAAAGGSNNMMIYILLAGAAAAAYFLLKK